MTCVRRALVSLPQGLLQELDGLAAMGVSSSRGQMVRDALTSYVQEKRRRFLLDNMIRGYQDMAVLNLALAEERLAEETDAFGRVGSARADWD